MRAKRSLGQNFLRDPNVVERIVGALNIDINDIVVEIGPGDGALTSRLIDLAGHVIAIEFDRDLLPTLKARFGNLDKFSLINDDALTVDLASILAKDNPTLAKLVANLPYNISTPILQRLIASRSLFSQIVLMFQREVVERITAPPGNSSRGFLSVLVEDAFETEYLFDVAPGSFSPVPGVWSAVVLLTPKISNVKDPQLFRFLVSSSFVQKRKTILNNLKGKIENAADILAKADVDGKRRAETLSLSEWERLTAEVSDQK